MAPKNSLVENINRRKRAGKSRPKSRSTVSKKSYADMEHGWPSKRKKSSKKKSSAKSSTKSKRSKSTRKSKSPSKIKRASASR
jgi:hypothetical protein